MMRRILFCCAIVMLAQLQGCVRQSLNAQDIKRGQEICAKLNSEAVEMNSWWNGIEEVSCYSGDTYRVWGNAASKLLKGD